ncbi:hypothetical protein QNH46_10960 [Paenibacillus woosongensis]|uniref:RNA polymerase subunit sigma n=1 Tax=Paenibacillus woosongensis TaxID=307580 RepID=A0AA95L2T2_9BACL|nr:hypothetical protein [Paenibacillus woosongensis]WHX51116.1 hypothetical protein QNH46_10960 [Paenibacillus woosongensis]GIP56519.1 hypothetical protein J15TS10_03330 [Paenibacillus woosongensis]
MNMKSVEMQIALPRTNEAGRIQQDQQQRPLIDQTILAGQNMKTSELERGKSQAMEQSARNKTVKREEDAASGQDKEQRDAEEQQEERDKEKAAKHPFKGRHIDLSL